MLIIHWVGVGGNNGPHLRYVHRTMANNKIKYQTLELFILFIFLMLLVRKKVSITHESTFQKEKGGTLLICAHALSHLADDYMLRGILFHIQRIIQFCKRRGSATTLACILIIFCHPVCCVENVLCCPQRRNKLRIFIPAHNKKFSTNSHAQKLIQADINLSALKWTHRQMHAGYFEIATWV